MRNGLVEGVSLRAVLRESEAMAPEAAASVLAGMLVTLAVVHGDVRPEHVRVDGSGGLALTDFGSTGARFVPNVATYLAPERLKGATATQTADVFSATAVFFECLTNETPFVAATRDDLAALHEYTEIIAEFAPPELRPLTQHGLAPDPARRPATPHAYLDEVTATVTEVYGPDWQARGRALLAGWAAAAAAAEGVELAAPVGRGAGLVAAVAEPAEAPSLGEAPPVGEPIEELLPGEEVLPVEDAPQVDELIDEAPPVGEPIEELPPVGEPIEELPPVGEPIDEAPPVGEPIDEALLGADVAPPAEPAEAQAADDGDYDWFSGGSKAGGVAPDASADVLAAFGDARAVRSAERAAADPYTPTGFDVFANRPAAVEPEPVSGHWDLPEVEDDGDQLTDSDALEVEVADADSLSAELGEDKPSEVADADASDGFEAFSEQAAEPVEADAELVEAVAEPVEADSAAEVDAESDFADTEFEPLIEDSSELLAAFDAFSPPAPEPEHDPFAGLETLAAASLTTPGAAEAADEQDSDSESAATETMPAADAEAEPDPEPETDAPEPEHGTDLEPEPETEAPAADASPEPEPETEAPDPDPRPDSTADLDEDDWVFKPGPKVPRSLAAFAVSLPSLPRPKTEDDEPKAPVQTSAPDDWFRPGVAEPVGEDAHHTQVLNPDRDNTIESEATRTLDEVPAEVVGIAEVAESAAIAADGAVDDDDDGPDDGELLDAPAGPGGPQRKTLIGVVATAVLLVAGATAVVLGGSGKSPQSTGPATPTESSSSSAPSPTDMPTTPVGTSTDSGNADTTSSSSTPSYHHSSTHSRSRSSSSSPSSRESTDQTPTHSSSSETPTGQSSSSTTPTSSAPTTPSNTCSTGILGFPDCGPTSTGGNSTKTPGGGN